MVLHVEKLLQSLQLPYRICVSAAAIWVHFRHDYDFEVYSVPQKCWRSALSQFESFQTNRMKIRIKMRWQDATVHSLNGSRGPSPYRSLPVGKSSDCRLIELPKVCILFGSNDLRSRTMSLRAGILFYGGAWKARLIRL